MRNFFKSIFGQPADNRVVIAPGDVVPRLDEEENRARSVLSAETEEPMRKIRDASARLQMTVNTLTEAEENPETHPRIKSIAKNSLPLFLRAMKSSLARDLPDDPEEFYTAAVDRVKGCLNAVRGQGRYLTVAFPEEMKNIQSGIDAIGREINVMTRALGRFKESAGRIERARTAAAALSGAEEDKKRFTRRMERIRERITGISERMEAISAETARLSSDESLPALEAERARCAELGRERDDLLRHYAAMTMTASHVFRKAEKIAVRKKLSREVHLLRDAMDILSHHEVATAEVVSGALDAAGPVVDKMIADGDIILKNREERVMFSGTGRFSEEVAGLCTRFREISSRCQAGEEALLSHPVPARIRALGREKDQLESMRAREEQETRDLLKTGEELEKTLPLLQENLKKTLVDLWGETVQLQHEQPVRG